MSKRYVQHSFAALALRAGEIKARHPLAHADALAAALAMQAEAALVTGDPEFRKSEGELLLEWVPVAE